MEITSDVQKLIEENVRSTINLYEPRAELQDVTASSNIDDNAVNVSITFYIRNVEQPISLDVFLERTR